MVENSEDKKRRRREDESKAKKEAELQEEKQSELGDSMKAAARTSVNALKSGWEKVKGVSGDIADISKVRYELMRLRSERDKQLSALGEKIWQLNNQDKLGKLADLLEDELSAISETTARVDEKEEALESITERMKS